MITRAGLARVVFLSLVSAIALAADYKPDTPTTIAGATIISVDQGKEVLDTGAAAFFDMRNPINFGKGHLPGATLLTYREKSAFVADFDPAPDRFDLSRLPADKNAPIVLYSDGRKGWKSYKAAVLARRAGYSNIMWMRDGYAAWTSRGLPVER